MRSDQMSCVCVCKRLNEILFRMHSQSNQIKFTVDEFDKPLSFDRQIAATIIDAVAIDAAAGVVAVVIVAIKSIH